MTSIAHGFTFCSSISLASSPFERALFLWKGLWLSCSQRGAPSSQPLFTTTTHPFLSIMSVASCYCPSYSLFMILTSKIVWGLNHFHALNEKSGWDKWVQKNCPFQDNTHTILFDNEFEIKSRHFCSSKFMDSSEITSYFPWNIVYVCCVFNYECSYNIRIFFLLKMRSSFLLPKKSGSTHRRLSRFLTFWNVVFLTQFYVLLIPTASFAYDY